MYRKRAVRLGFAGDLMLGGEAMRYAHERRLDLTYPLKALLPTLAGLDVLFVNLEGPLFQDGAAAMRKLLLLSNDPAVVQLLKLPRICVCSLANNHSLDYGPEALFMTQKHLDQHRIRHLGAGRTAVEAERPLVIEHAGWRIGCLAFTAREPGLQPIIAGDGNPGCASLQDTRAVLESVRGLRKRVDLVVVMLHWGLEFHEYPSAAQVRLAHSLVDAGAHIIAGHHPHTIQAVEAYNGAVIAYSLGHLYMPPFRLSLDRRPRPTEKSSSLPHSSKALRSSGRPSPSLKEKESGPVFWPRPASREFMLMRVQLPTGFPRSPGAVDAVAGGLDERFRLRPYNRIGLRMFHSRLDNLGCPLRNGGYERFWRQYRAWRRVELAAWGDWPAIEELRPSNLKKRTT